MYTVIIAEQEHIEKFREYGLFLEPFMKKSQFGFCLWKPEERDSLKDSVPGLEEMVAHKEEWRALILCDEAGLKKKNPFNVVEFHPPVFREEDNWTLKNLKEYYGQRMAAREAAFCEAADQPLVRLVTRLCEDPVIRKKDASDGHDLVLDGIRRECEDSARLSMEKTLGTEEVPSPEGEGKTSVPDDDRIIRGTQEYVKMREALELGEYRGCALYKRILRNEIRGGEPVPFSCPKEVLCLAKRHHDDMEYALQCVWSNHDEWEYSRFCDWNMYYDKMRFLVFDVVDKNRQTYTGDYIRFLFAALLIAGNETPMSALKPNRVYQLCCELNEANMAELLGRYDARLSATISKVQGKISEIRSKQADRISDETVEKIFCGHISIPVNMQDSYNKEDLIFTEKIGLSKDCPADDEETVWMTSYENNRKEMRKFLRQPPRAVKKGAEDLRVVSVVTDERAVVLNEFQREDLQGHIDQEEREMVDTITGYLYDPRHFYDRMEKEQQEVLHEIACRMRRTPTIVWGTLALVMVLFGMIPTVVCNLSDFSSMPYVGGLTLGMLGAVSLTALVCLFVFRGQLKDVIRRYNAQMRSIEKEVWSSVDQYSAYFSHACNVMRGNSVLSYYEEHADRDSHRIRILQKHTIDMQEQQAIVKDIFGEIVPDAEKLKEYDEPAYDYNFERAVDYRYPLPPVPGLNAQVDFMEPGNKVEVPYGIIKRVELRREELYD